MDWENFIDEKTMEFQTLYPEKKIAPIGSILRENLNEVLSLIDGKPLHNVLMYFHAGDPQVLRTSYEEVKFTELLIQYDNRRNLIEMNC